MRIDNVRLGFATNSSSTHSIVVAASLPKEIAPPYFPDFDRSFFRLVTRESKRAYLIGILRAIHFGSREEDASAIEKVAYRSFLQDLFDNELDDIDLDAEYAVDHQSVPELPSFATSSDWRRFWTDYAEFLLSDKVVILGGSDEVDFTDTEFDWRESGIPRFPWIGDGATYQLRHHGNKHWTVFDPTDGTKVRLCFDLESPPLQKGAGPELVDVKITDFCPFGCSFCYQSSTKEGLHADLDYLKDLFCQLARQGVFEIAIGGGEPTMHPNFIEILESARAAGLTVNFTTFSKLWLKDEAIVSAVRRNVSGIGVSVHDEKGLGFVRAVAAAVNGDDGGYQKVSWQPQTVTVTAQHVFGSLPARETIDLVRICAEETVGILLLGWKSFGFADSSKGHDLETRDVYEAMRLITQEFYVTLSVDTAMVENHPGLLEALDASDILVCPGEGRFSAYVDAVTRRIAASSYTRDTIPYPVVDDAAFTDAWCRF